MSKPAQRLDIIVDPKLPVDAMKSHVDGVTTLVLRPQTFDNAVEHVRSVLPGITVEGAEQMVRTQCPEFRSFDDLLGPSTPPAPRVDYVPDAPSEGVAKERFLPRKRRRQAVLVAALLPALAVSWGLGRYTNVVSPPPSIASAVAEPGAQTVPAPFADTRFEYFAGSSSIECSTVSTLAAECTDADGMVMSTKAATGPDSTIFTFSYGSERIGLRIFYDANYADTWARQDGSREMYPNMKVYGRYALWGTDTGRIDEYVGLLEEADRARYRGPSPSAMGWATTPLPPRLAALTLGTLGLTRQEAQRIIAGPEATIGDGPAMLAARLVLGLGSRVGGGIPGGDDIVALAAGLEAPRSDDGSSPPHVHVAPEPSVPPAIPPVPAPAPPVTVPPSVPEPTPTPTPPATTPPPTPPVATPPVAPPPTSPPLEEIPSPPQPVPSEPETPVPPKAEEPPAPSPEDMPAPAEPPAEESPLPGQDVATPGGFEEQDVDEDLLLVNSAWSVSAG